MNARAVAFAFLLAACVPVAAQPLAPAGAAACSGCHAVTTSAGAAVPPIHGRAVDDIVGAMVDFRAGKRNPTVMDRIAKGFTDEETRAIAVWLAAQR
jgi:cytochrome c553